MKNTAKQDWFDDLINDFVPTCPQLSPQPRGQKEVIETRMDKGFKNSVPNVPPVPTKKYDSEKISSITQKHEALISSWLYHISEPEEDRFLILNKCRLDPEVFAFYLERAIESKREERRAKVLTILADNPNTQRAFIADMDSDPENVLLTIAIRDQYSFEITIPKAKYDSFGVLETIKNTASDN